MGLHRSAIALAALCYALLLLGGHVHNTGSSLACGTDWPRCHGVWMPRMQGGVLFEHSHRILAALVGLGAVAMTVALALRDRRRGARGSLWIGLSAVGMVLAQLAGLAVLASRGPRHGEAAAGDVPALFTGLAAVGMLTLAGSVALAFRRGGGSLLGWGLLGVGLVVAQGLLGALTVAVGLSPAISTAHLATSMLFFAALLVVAFRTRPSGALVLVPAPARALAMATTVLLYAQMLLGAAVRHVGAGMICGREVPLCMGRLWPPEAHYGVYLHIVHRAAGLAVLALAFLVWRAVRRGTADPSVRRAALALPLLLLLQVALGVAAVLSILDAATVTAHLGVAAAAFADLVWLLLATRSLGVASRVSGGITAPQRGAA